MKSQPIAPFGFNEEKISINSERVFGQLYSKSKFKFRATLMQCFYIHKNIKRHVFEKCLANSVDISLLLIIGIPPTSREYLNWNISLPSILRNVFHTPERIILQSIELLK